MMVAIWNSIKAFVLLGAVFGMFRCAAQQYRLLVGTYTTGTSEGIYVYSFDAQSGRLSYRYKIKVPDNPTYLAVSEDHRYVYSVHTTGGEKGGGVSSFSFDPASGHLRFLNRVRSEGDRPVYVSVDRKRQHVFVANYAGGNFSVVAVGSDGTLGRIKQIVTYAGQGPDNIRRVKSHVHMTHLSPDNQYLFVTDLGTDRIEVYRYGEKTEPPLFLADSLTTPPGSGPRHLAFHPGGRFVYAVFELTGQVGHFRYRKGRLYPKKYYEPYPADQREYGAADIKVSPDRKFLYVSYRAALNELAVYSIHSKTGALTLVGRQSTLGRAPRNFVMDPSGRYLLVAHQDSSDIIVFERDKTSGLLKGLPVGCIEVSNPSCLVLVPVKK